MKQILTDIGLFTGAFMGVVNTLDLLLSDQQKVQTRRFGEHLWLFLSDQKGENFIRAFTAYKVQLFVSVALFGILAVLNAVVWVAAGSSNHDNATLALRTTLLPMSVYLVACWIFVSRTIHPRILGWISEGASIPRYFWRSFVALVVCIVPYVSINATAMLFGASHNGNATEISIISWPFVVAGLLVGPFAVEVWLLFMTAVLSVIWLAAVWIGMGIIRTLQFILLRVVDYPKGPILGLSGLLVGGAALIKIFL